MKALAEQGEKGLLAIVEATQSDMSVEEFFKEVLEWTATAQHPRFKRPYTDLVYEPMLELMRYLRLFAFGNSDGDLQMLQWTAAHPGARFMGIVHRDAEREYAYDRSSCIVRLDKALDEAKKRGWTV